MDNPEQNATIPQPGQQVRVIDGPFTDYEGIVETVNEEEKKAQVAVSFFGRPTLVLLFFYQFEPLA